MGSMVIGGDRKSISSVEPLTALQSSNATPNKVNQRPTPSQREQKQETSKSPLVMRANAAADVHQWPDFSGFRERNDIFNTSSLPRSPNQKQMNTRAENNSKAELTSPASEGSGRVMERSMTAAVSARTFSDDRVLDDESDIDIVIHMPTHYQPGPPAQIQEKEVVSSSSPSCNTGVALSTNEVPCRDIINSAENEKVSFTGECQQKEIAHLNEFVAVVKEAVVKAVVEIPAAPKPQRRPRLTRALLNRTREVTFKPYTIEEWLGGIQLLGDQPAAVKICSVENVILTATIATMKVEDQFTGSNGCTDARLEESTN